MPQEVELLIKILSARGLRDAAPDLFGLQAANALPHRDVSHPPMQKPGRQTMEPYCICEIMGRDDGEAPSVRTAPLAEEDAPQWNHKKKMVILEGDTLIFMVNWKDDDSEDDLIGWAKLDFDSLMPTGFVGELRLTDASASKELPAFLKVSVKPTSLADPEELDEVADIADVITQPPPLAPVLSHFAGDQETVFQQPEQAVDSIGDTSELPLVPPSAAQSPVAPELPMHPSSPKSASPKSPKSPKSPSPPASPASPGQALPGQVERLDATSPSVGYSNEETTDLGSPTERLEAPVPKKQSKPKGKKRSGGAGKPPPPPPKVPEPPPLVPKKELNDYEDEVVSAIDLLCRQKRPLRHSLEEALDLRQSLVEADADDEGKLSSFGVQADEGPKAFGQVLAQAWTGNAGRSPAPVAHVLPWPSQEVTHREVPGLRGLGKPVAARLRGLLLHLERAVALDPEISASDLLQQDLITEAGKPEVNLQASGLGKFPPPLMVAGNVEPMPLTLTALSSDEEDSARWPSRSSVKENRSKVKGCTVRVAGQVRSTDAGFGAHPELRILALQGKFEDAHGSLSAAFAAMDLESRGYVSFGDFHSHLVRLHLSSVDAEGSSRAMELFKLLDSDADDLLSPRDCLKAFRGAAALVKERADNAVHQERLQAFLRERGLPLDMQIPRHKALGGDQYSRAMSLQRYLVLKYGSLYEAIHSMDSSGIGFVSKDDFVQRLLSDRYCLSEYEAEELFQSFDPWGKGWLPLQRMLEYEVSGMEWLRPWVNAASPRSASPRGSPSPRGTSPRSSPRSASPRSARRSGTRSPDRFFASPRSAQGSAWMDEEAEDRSDFLFSDPGRLDGPPPSSPRRQPTKRSPRSSAHERLHIAGIGHKRALPGDDALRSAYQNLEEARNLMDEMKRKAKERAAAAMKAVDEARDRAQAAKAAAASGSVPPSLQAPGPVERFRASRPQSPQIPVPAINLQPVKDDESLGPLTPATTPREAVEGSDASPGRISAVRAMASAASAASGQSGESRSALQQRRKAREQRRKEIMKVMDADGDGVITQSELDQLKAANPELSQVDMSKLDADGDGEISKEELEKALDFDGEPQTQAEEAASLFSAVANLFGRPSQASVEREPQPKEAKDEVKDTATPKAKALPKALFAMTRVNLVAGRKGSLAVSSEDPQGSSQGTSAARKRRDLKKAGKAAALLAVPGRQDADGNG